MITPIKNVPNPIPPTAAVLGMVNRGVLTPYYIWEATTVGWWCWDALGNNGKEPSKESAMRVARRWIRDGQ